MLALKGTFENIATLLSLLDRTRDPGQGPVQNLVGVRDVSCRQMF